LLLPDSDSLFFFQAEDGIRDLYVTGVQTCALPISHSGVLAAGARAQLIDQPILERAIQPFAAPARLRRVRRNVLDAQPGERPPRSEERRVGKGGRVRGGGCG